MNLIDDWIEYQRTKDDRFWPSAEKVFDMPTEDPEGLWSFILAAKERADGDRMILSNLAAGPLEDLINKHGDAFVDRIVLQARRDPSFNFLLGGVWEAGGPEVRKKIESIRNHRW